MQTPHGVFYTDPFTSAVIWQSTSGTLSMHFAESRATLHIDGRALYVWVGGTWHYMTPQGEPDTPMEPNPMQYVLFAILHAYCTQHPDDARQNGFPVMEEHDV